METIGYAIIRNGAKGLSSTDIENFYDTPVRILEFSVDGGVLVIDSMATGIAMFDKPDIIRSFRCSVFGGVIVPPDLNIIEQMEYSYKCVTRKGGYCAIVAQMVIVASIHRGEFCDSVLWYNQE